MQALLLVDVQNEFSKAGLRAVSDFDAVIAAISRHVEAARAHRTPIAWVRHHNKPHESRAFVPGSWGAELTAGFGPTAGHGAERLFDKDVYGAFGAAGLERWLRDHGVRTLLVGGFYTHMCVSTSVREALIRGFDVLLDPQSTGAGDIADPRLGKQTAAEVRRSALLQLVSMGAMLIETRPVSAQGSDIAETRRDGSLAR